MSLPRANPLQTKTEAAFEWPDSHRTYLEQPPNGLTFALALALSPLQSAASLSGRGTTARSLRILASKFMSKR